MRHRGAGLAVGKRQAAADDSVSVVGAPPSQGNWGHPIRSCLMRVERGNPVPVRPDSCWRAGRPTVRKADAEREQDAQEANAGGRKATGNRDNIWSSPGPVPHNWPDTGPMPGPERVLT